MNSPTIAAIAFCIVAVIARAPAQGSCWSSAVGTALGASDESTHQVTLPFAFPLPGGGSSTSIRISSNGFVWLDADAPDSSSADFGGTSLKLRSAGPRIAAWWDDLNTPADVHFVADSSTARITWDMKAWLGSDTAIAQLELFPDGSFQIAWQATTATGVVGISQGQDAAGSPAPDPGAADLSAGLSGGGSTIYESFDALSPADLVGLGLLFTPNPGGGYDLNRALCDSAAAVPYGQGCPQISGGVIYEYFAGSGAQTPDTPDLPSGFSLHYQATATGYLAKPCSANCWEATYQSAPALSISSLDDGLDTVNLPWTVTLCGVNTDALDVSSNGFVWLQSGSSTETGFIPHPALMLSEPPRIAALWTDLDPSAAGQIYADSSVPGKVTITWDGCSQFNGGALGNLQTFQLQVFQNGDLIVSYPTLDLSPAGPIIGDRALVGFSGGGGRVDPGETDLSLALPQPVARSLEPLRLGLRPLQTPKLGSTVHLTATGLNGAGLSGTGLALMAFGFEADAIDGGVFGAPGCELSLVPLQIVGMNMQAGFAELSQPIPNNPGLIGLRLLCQAAASPQPPLNGFGWISSNGLELIVGL